jgi:hypothetical protein
VPKHEFVSFVVLARDLDDSRLQSVCTRLNEIGNEVGRFHEIIAVRTPRKRSQIYSSSTTSALTESTADLTILEFAAGATTASLAVAGLERSLGDVIVILEGDEGQAEFSPNLVKELGGDTNVVFAQARLGRHRGRGLTYFLGKKLASLALISIRRTEATWHLYRALDREVTRHILDSTDPAHTFRLIGRNHFFNSTFVPYESKLPSQVPRFWESYGSLMQILFGGSKVPLRIASLTSVLGAILNVFYAIYVVVVSFLEQNVEPGWASLSLQSSGMFFLVCVVLFITTEYLLRLIDDSAGSSISTSLDFKGLNSNSDNHLNVDQVEDD